MFRLCLVNGRLNEDRARRVVARVIASSPRGYLALLSQFQRLVRLDLARHTAEVESAVALPADLRARVRANLEDSYGHGLNILFADRPDLIGGIRIKVGNDFYDGSVKGRLAALERSF